MSGAPKPETGAPGSVVSDGQKSCVRGTFVRVADEYAGWDVFKKFTGKVGTLTWRHFSGMWYADFPGEDEYGFLCGPLLFQLQYSSEEEARESVLALEKIRKERERKNALESEKSKQLAQALEKRAKELSATTVKLFEQMAIIQAEMEKAEMDLNKMERAFADLTVHANALDAELGATRSELRTVQSEKAEVQSQLADSRANVERLEKRIRELISERDKLQAELSQTVTENVMLSKELHEAGERSRQLDFENAEFKEENAKLQEELAHCKAQLGQLEESFLKARQEGADYMAKWERANAELKELERVNPIHISPLLFCLDFFVWS
jgi:chromosome segregation ATPase